MQWSVALWIVGMVGVAHAQGFHASGPVSASKPVVELDHDATKLPLTGAHARVACVTCHPKTELAITKPACAGCHAPKHASTLFDTRACETCHSNVRFDVVTFDHGARVPLEGGHRIACVQCHTPARGKTVPAACEGCHRERPHGRRFEPHGCAACHTAVTWKQIAFDHGKQTKLALTGKHRELPCRACHRGDDFEKLQRGCKECHAHRVVHADAANPTGKFTTNQCLGCHTIGSEPPRPMTRFFHGPQSTFPLVKGHKAARCVDCHTRRDARGRVEFHGLSPQCGPACHADVAHAGALGAGCASCHVAGQWQALRFVHDRYPLLGEHARAACVSCHGTSKRFRGTPRRCADAACHVRDDVHAGALGTTCDRCHLPTGENRFTHLISAKYRLDGKHLQVPCADCHPTRSFKPRPFACGGCHPDPAVHKGMHGTFCERCHTTRGWRAR